MGWKNVKDHYQINHLVQVCSEGICIGSPYIHNLLVISLDGKLIKEDNWASNKDLLRYQAEMLADPEKLRELVLSKDEFQTFIRVFTYDGGEIIEKYCEEPGWPNVTHDGDMMYENTFSEKKSVVIKWAKSNCLAAIGNRHEWFAENAEKVADNRKRLNKALANAKKLGIPDAQIPMPPDFDCGNTDIVNLINELRGAPAALFLEDSAVDLMRRAAHALSQLNTSTVKN